MKYGVSSNTLLLTAGIVWLVAGINIPVSAFPAG